MTERKFTISAEGVDYSGKIATIKSTMLGTEDHGILTAYLFMEAPGWGIGVGGYPLDRPVHNDSGKFLRREPTAYGFDQVVWLMKTVGVSKWEDLPGKDVIVLFEHNNDGWGSITVGIANLIDESEVFIFKDHYESWKDREDEKLSA